MKKIILSLAAVASLSAANAQKLGDVFVNGSIGYHYSSEEVNAGTTSVNGPVSHNFQLMPSIGYQFNNNWGAGLAFQYGYNRATANQSGVDVKTTTNIFGVGPFLRYTKHLSPMFFVNGQLNAMYVTGKSTSEAAGVTSTSGRQNGVDVNVMPSIGINVTRRLALTGAFGRLGYATVKNEDPSNSNNYLRTNAFDATFGREFMLGLQWHFATDAGRGRRRMEPMSETRNMDRYRDTDNDNATEEAPRRRRRSRD